MHKTIRRILLKSLLGFLIVTVSVVAGTATFFSLPPGEKILRNSFENLLSQTLIQDVKIQRLETNLISRLQLFQARISPSDSVPAQPVLSVDFTRIHFWIGDLLRKKPIFRSIDVDGFDLVVIRDTSGVSTIPWLFGDAETDTTRAERALELRVDQLTARNVDLTYSDMELSLQGIVKGLYLDLAISEGIIPFVLGADSADLKISSYPFSIKGLSLEGQWQDDLLEISNLCCRVQDMALDGGIALRFDTPGTGLAGQCTLKGDFQSVIDYFQWDVPDPFVPIEGSMQLDCELTGTLADYSLGFTAFFPALQSAGVNLHNGVAQGIFHADSIHVNELEVQVEEGTAHASGWVIPYRNYPYFIDLQAANLDPGRLWPPIFEYFEWKMPAQAQPITGEMLLDCEFIGSLDELSIVFDARLPSLHAADLILQDNHVQGRLHSDTLTIHNMVLQPDEGTVLASGWLVTYNPYPHHVNLRSANLDLASLWPPILDYFQWQIPDNMSPIEGKLDLDCKLAGTSADLSIGFSAQVPSLRAANVAMRDVIVEGAYQVDTLIIHQIGLQINEGTLQGSGWLVPSHRFPHHLSLHSVNLDMASLSRLAYGLESPFAGRLSGSVDSRGSLAELSGVQVQSRLELSGATYLNRPIPDYSFQGTVSQGIAQLALLHGETEIHARAQMTDDRLRGEFTAQLSLVEHLLQLFNIDGIRGSGRISGTIDGYLDNPRVTADFSGYGLNYFRFPCDSLTGRLSYHDGQLFFENGHAAGRLADLEALEPPLRLDGLSGGLAYRGNFSGWSENPRASLSISLDRPAYRGYQIDRLELDLGLDEGLLRINTVAGQKDSLVFWAEGSVSLRDSTGTIQTNIYIVPTNTRITQPSGRTDLKTRLESSGRKLGNVAAQMTRHDNLGLSVAVQGAGIDLGVLAPYAGVNDPLGGKLQFRFETPLSAPLHPLSVEFQVERPSYAPFTWDLLRGRIIADRQDLTIESLELNRGPGPPVISANVTLAGYGNQGLRLDPNTIITGQLDLSRLDLEWFTPLLDEGQLLQGSVSGTLAVTGTLRKPRVAGRLDLLESLVQMDARVQPVSSMSAQVLIEDSRVTVESLTGEIQGSPFLLEGAVDLGALPALGIDLRLTVASIPAVGVAGRLAADSSSLMINVEDLNLALLQPLMPGVHSISGSLSSRVLLEGPLIQPRLNGNIRLDGGRLQITGESIPYEAVVMEISLEDTLLTLHNLEGLIQGNPLQLRGKLTIHRNTTLEMDLGLLTHELEIASVRGILGADTLMATLRAQDMDLALIQPFLTPISNFSGRVTANVEARGRPTDPVLGGNLALRDVSLYSSDDNLQVQGGFLTIVFERKHIRIDSVFAGVSSGTLWGNGSLDYDAGQLINLDLSVHSRNIRYSRPRQYSLTVQSADLTLKEADQAYFLDGDIALGDSRFTRTIQPREILTFFTSIDRPRAELPGVLRKTRLNLRIRDSRQLWIDNNLARVRIRGNLTLLGSLSDPILAGRFTVEEGYALYLDRRFTVKEGLVNFVDPVRVNPDITLIAESSIKPYMNVSGTAYTVTLAVRGPLDQVSVELISEPPLDKADIVSMLTVGATREQLMGGKLTGALQDRLLGLSSERISRYTAQRLGTLLNLDDVTIEGNLFNYQKSWGPQLVASRALSDRMEITYRTTIGQFNDQGFRLDYTLSKYLLLAGTTNSSGQSGLDLKFRLQFK